VVREPVASSPQPEIDNAGAAAKAVNSSTRGGKAMTDSVGAAWGPWAAPELGKRSKYPPLR
jgi:hypothetical protein